MTTDNWKPSERTRFQPRRKPRIEEMPLVMALRAEIARLTAQVAELELRPTDAEIIEAVRAVRALCVEP